VERPARTRLRDQFGKLHRAMLAIVRRDDVCRRLMTVPGIGALIAVTFTSAVDQPERFSRSRAVGAHFGLTPKWTCLKAMESTFMTQEVLHAPIPPTLYAGIPG